MTCDILDTIGVEGLLAFSAVLLEVNLQHSNHVGRKWGHGQFFHFQILKANTLANPKNPRKMLEKSMKITLQISLPKGILIF